MKKNNKLCVECKKRKASTDKTLGGQVKVKYAKRICWGKLVHGNL